MKGLVGRSVDVASMRSKTVKLRFSIDNLGIAEKIVKFDTNEREAEFEQEIYFDKAGDILFSVDLEVGDEDAIRVNNRSQFRIQVHNERRKVVLISNEIGLDKAFYTRILRRNPALDVKTLYTRAKYPDSRRDPCAQLQKKLFILGIL